MYRIFAGSELIWKCLDGTSLWAATLIASRFSRYVCNQNTEIHVIDWNTGEVMLSVLRGKTTYAYAPENIIDSALIAGMYA